LETIRKNSLIVNGNICYPLNINFLWLEEKTYSAGIDKLEQEGILRDNQRHEHALRQKRRQAVGFYMKTT
jgi:hypothetical protein